MCLRVRWYHGDFPGGMGDTAFQGFLRKIAVAHVSHRHEYWKARKRDAGVLLRTTSSSVEPWE